MSSQPAHSQINFILDDNLNYYSDCIAMIGKAKKAWDFPYFSCNQLKDREAGLCLY